MSWSKGVSRWHRRSGALSLLLISIVMPLVLVLSTCLSIARRQADEAQLLRAMRTQLQTSLAGYDPDLNQQFGLFGVAEGQLETSVYQELLPNRFRQQQVEIKMAQSVLDQQNLAAQISRTMKIRLPMLWFSSLRELFQAGNESGGLKQPEIPALMDASEMLSGPQEPELNSVQNQFIEALVNALSAAVEPEIKDQLTNLMDSVDEIGDFRSSLQGSDSMPQILSQISRVLDLISSGTDSPLLRQVELAEYCIAYLTRSVTDRRVGDLSEPIETVSGLQLKSLIDKRPAEVEMVLTGAATPEKAISWTKTTIIAVRSLINLADILADSSQMARLRTTAMSATAAISLASGMTVNIDPEMIAQLLAVGEAIRQGHQDYVQLSDGKAVALLPSNLLPDSMKKWALEMTYQDYLRLMLLTIPQDELIDRIGDRIRTAFEADFAHELEIAVTVDDHDFARNPANGKVVRLAMAYDA